VINTKLLPILHRFRDIAFKIGIFRSFATPLAFNPAGRAVSYIISLEVISKNYMLWATLLSLKV